ncbi:Protein of unknown function (DUF2930) [Xenococcus sp. PCC 7305]|uniref:cofactor assembly of complex C subunit B n=1 Tax=Xenococcus sp. PCC 7305 TaxID=102125 RepID=UPI0002ABA54D|nr:cofactor assembly of complex C subunit B [Xenococcus sp. PCC 7305]ELS00829.1 Protein of unknown function (DUF2930) [Xenococcus sp. PCC 7305]
MTNSDPNRIVRLLPIAVGGLAGSLLMINRLLTVQLTSSQSRSDALGIIEGATLLLVGVLWQQIQARTPEAVALVGEPGLELTPELPENIKTELAWASHLLLSNTVTRSLVVYYDGKTLLRRGILGKNFLVNPGAIVSKVIEQQKPIYLVSLKLYPGKVEFDYLPENTQGIICQPIGTKGVLILGANAPRSYTKQDEQWIAGIADKLAESLRTQ